MNQIKRKIVGNFILSLLGRCFSVGLGIVALSFTIRTLGIDSFGEYNVVLTILYILSVCGSFGLDALLVQKIGQEKALANENEIIARIFFSRSVTVSLFLLLGGVGVFFLPYSFMIRGGVVLVLLGGFFSSLAQLLVGILQKHLKMSVVVYAEIGMRCIQLFASWYLYYREATLFPFLLVFGVANIFYFIVIYYWVKRITGFSFRIRREWIMPTLSQGWPFAISVLLTLIYFRGGTIFLSLLQSAHDVGIYSMAYRVFENALFIPIAFVGLIMPFLSRHGSLQKKDFCAVFQDAFNFLSIITIPFIVGGIYFSRDIILLIAGKTFHEALIALQILFVALFFVFFGALFGQAVIALEKQKKVLWVYGTGSVLSIIGNAYFITHYSYRGAAWMTVVIEMIITGGLWYLIYKTIRFLPSFVIFGKALLASLCMVVVFFLFSSWHFLILIGVGMIVYFVCMYLLGAFSAITHYVYEEI